MKKYRIVKLTHFRYTEGDIEFFIETKVGKIFKIWKQIQRIEGDKKTRIIFKTYEEAEQYLKLNYTGDGWLRQDGNYYTYEDYEYWI